MKIDKSSNSLPSASVNESTARANPPKAAGSAVAPKGVNVSLGSTTSQLRSMENNIASTPLVDAKKVAEIKQAISEGRFQINSGVIADRLIGNVKDLISASKH
ncbi:MAG: flagellar biosynthesis anti-sigma factor FlgM [Gallionellaceae bacterium]|nr:MAG: flagellar biosynthesis anti-sigma factor FlgM [Gallionellaceae bacterium]